MTFSHTFCHPRQCSPNYYYEAVPSAVCWIRKRNFVDCSERWRWWWWVITVSINHVNCASNYGSTPHCGPEGFYLATGNWNIIQLTDWHCSTYINIFLLQPGTCPDPWQILISHSHCMYLPSLQSPPPPSSFNIYIYIYMYYSAAV